MYQVVSSVDVLMDMSYRQTRQVVTILMNARGLMVAVTRSVQIWTVLTDVPAEKDLNSSLIGIAKIRMSAWTIMDGVIKNAPTLRDRMFVPAGQDMSFTDQENVLTLMNVYSTLKYVIRGALILKEAITVTVKKVTS